MIVYSRVEPEAVDRVLCTIVLFFILDCYVSNPRLYYMQFALFLYLVCSCHMVVAHYSLHPN